MDMDMDKLKKILEEEEFLNKIANLPKESRERFLLAIEDTEKREELRKRVEEIRRKKKEQKLSPINRAVITDITLNKELAPLSVVVLFVFILVVFWDHLSDPFVLSFLLLFILMASFFLYFSGKYYDEIVKKYYDD